MRRRDFLIAGGASALSCQTARAQKQTGLSIGFLGTGSPDTTRMNAFKAGFESRGISVGDVRMLFRFAADDTDMLRAQARELVESHVSMIVATGVPAALAAKASTSSSQTPIVFNSGADPTALNLVDSLAKPGGNMTGVSNLSVELSSKRVEILHQVTSSQTVVLVFNDDNRLVSEAQIHETHAAAERSALKLEYLPVNARSNIREVLGSIKPGKSVVIGNDGLLNRQVQTLGSIVRELRLPAIFQYRIFCESGGLLAYGASPTDQYELLGVYAGRVIQGENPRDLPIVQSTKMDLIINLSEAKALGATLPLELLALADEVIE